MNLAEGLAQEQARVRGVLKLYYAIGPAGAFGAAMIEADLRAAEQAIASGDVVAMLQAYETLKEISE